MRIPRLWLRTKTILNISDRVSIGRTYLLCSLVWVYGVRNIYYPCTLLLSCHTPQKVGEFQSLHLLRRAHDFVGLALFNWRMPSQDSFVKIRLIFPSYNRFLSFQSSFESLRLLMGRFNLDMLRFLSQLLDYRSLLMVIVWVVCTYDRGGVFAVI